LSMKTKTVLFSVLALLILSVIIWGGIAGCVFRPVLTIVEEGESPYRIIVSRDISKEDQRAAAELQRHIKRISGVEILIMTDDSPVREHEILVGRNRHLRELNIKIDFNKLEDDGFTIRTKEKNLVIAGGREKGTLYGVYAFLEDCLGCRKYSASVSIVPKKDVVRIRRINRTDVPFIKHREVHMPDAFDDDYADWHKLDNRNVRTRKWGMWVHTFRTLVPPEKYFKDHPEYFSEVNGQRLPDTQLCLTNPDVLRIVVDGLKEMIKEKPEAKYWSVSQNDTFYPCACVECRAQDEKYGGHSGSILHFVNQVAREFPDKVISTLAYQYSRSAPIDLLPAENVNIMLCTIELNRSRPIPKDSSSASFRKDIEDWGRLTDNIIIWDYVVQFRNLIDPFPNLRVLQPNIRYFVKNNVRMMFQQGSDTLRSEFHELRTYIIAKLLWNPDANVNAIFRDFTDGYYGRAGKYIRQYIRLMHNALKRSRGDLLIYGYPWDGVKTYLTPSLIGRYAKIFDKAEAAVSHEPQILDRVRFARLPLEFAILEISRWNVSKKLSLFKKVDGKWKANPEMRKRLERFVDLANEFGITKLEERGTSPNEYRALMEDFLQNGMRDHLAINKPVQLITEHSEKYPVGGAEALTDGLKGPADYHCNWLGFEGNELKAVIDLEEEQDISRISMDFLQDHNSWVWLPKKVKFFISQDGLIFKPVGEIKNKSDEKKPGAFIENFCCKFLKVKTRYVKVETTSLLQCPKWHKGYEGLSWIFTDEVVID